MYFQRFPFIETNKYLFKAFTEEEFDTKGWVQNLKSLLDRTYDRIYLQDYKWSYP